MDDEALVRAARSGDLAATEALLARHQRLAYTTALRLLGEPAEAEDTAQDALIRAFTHLADLQEEEAFAPWLRRIAVNLSLSVLRRRGQLRLDSLDADDAASADPPWPACRMRNGRRCSCVMPMIMILPRSRPCRAVASRRRRCGSAVLGQRSVSWLRKQNSRRCRAEGRNRYREVRR